MSKRAIRAMATLVICLMLCGCGPLADCKVAGKDYQPAHTVLMPYYNGKNIGLMPTYYPEEYYLIIEGTDEDGETRQRKVQVSASEYENAVIGQEWEGEIW